MATANTLEGGTEGEVDVQEGSFDLQKHLENYQFTEYSKIEAAIASKELTLEDILGCNESELKDALSEYGVNAIQRNRFVKAIKALPNSKMHMKQSSSYVMQSAQLTQTDESIINGLNKTSKHVKTMINKLQTSHKDNIQKIQAAKAKLEDILETEEKEYESKLNLLLSYDEECTKLHENYQSHFSNLSKDKEVNISKRLKLDESKEFVENKVNNINIQNNNVQILIKYKNTTQTFASSSVNINKNNNRNNVNNKNGNKNNNSNKNNSPLALVSTHDWTLAVSGIEAGVVRDNRKTFFSNWDCLARTDLSMKDDSGVYIICWKIEILKDVDYWNAVGLCTGYYQVSVLRNRCKKWIASSEYIGWCGRDDETSKNRLVCGRGKREENIFYSQCKFNGNPLPQYKEDDIIGLIYDSNQQTLQFSKNSQILESTLTNIPRGLQLFWFVGRYNGPIKFSIVDQSNIQNINNINNNNNSMNNNGTGSMIQAQMQAQAPVAPDFLPDDYLNKKNDSKSQKIGYTYQ